MRFGGNASIMYLITWLKAQSKGFAMLRNDSPEVAFLHKIGHAKSVSFQFELVIWWRETGITSKYLEITSSFFGYNKYFNLFKE